jgi:hypothetical protein
MSTTGVVVGAELTISLVSAISRIEGSSSVTSSLYERVIHDIANAGEGLL